MEEDFQEFWKPILLSVESLNRYQECCQIPFFALQFHNNFCAISWHLYLHMI